MSEQQKTRDGRSWIVLIVRWTARLTAAILGVILLMFIIGEGFIAGGGPPPWHILAPWLVVLAGFALGWKYEGLGAVLILVGFIYFNACEYAGNGRLLRLGAFHLLLLPALAFLFCWIMERKKPTCPTVTPATNPTSTTR